MRTKTLLLTVALVAAGAASSMAQVYSQNAVGYINVACKPGYNLIANQLIQTPSTVSALITAPPNLTRVLGFVSGVGGGFTGSTFDSDEGGWSNPNLPMALGGGNFVLNPTASDFTITFVGDVAQGNVGQSIPQGFSIQSSKVPQAGLVTTVLGLAAPTPANGTAVYKYVNNPPAPAGYVRQTYDSDEGGWAEPSVAVGEAVFILSPVAGQNWVRTFSVN